MKKISLLALLMLTGCIDTDMVANSVMVTNLGGNSGGSGTIVASHKDHSEILTNSHVCEVARHGGLVIRENGARHMIKSFKQSQTHDLCLITVPGNLGTSADLAETMPYPMETSVVSGHPHLLPLIINKGHFSGNIVIKIMTGTRECTADDGKDPVSGFLCALLGRLPIIRSYESTVVSNIIQPGSSGSGVYNSRGELSAVIFAGNGDIGYGLAVPYNNVRSFLRQELEKLPEQAPDTTMPLKSEGGSDSYKEKALEACSKVKEPNEICKVLNSEFGYVYEAR